MWSLTDFHDLVQTTEGELRAFITGWGITPSEVDDLAQEAYLSYFEDAERRPAGVEEIAWLKGIARNLCRDHVRRKERNRRHLEELGQLLRRHRAAHEPADLAEQEQAVVHLQECLAQLPDDQRELLIHRYVDGHPTEAIAQRTGRRSGTLRMVLMRVRATLRACLQRKTARHRRQVS